MLRVNDKLMTNGNSYCPRRRPYEACCASRRGSNIRAASSNSRTSSPTADNRRDFRWGRAFCGRWSTVDYRLWSRRWAGTVNRSQTARIDVALRDCRCWGFRTSIEWPWTRRWSRGRCDSSLEAFSRPIDGSCWDLSRTAPYRFPPGRRGASVATGIRNRNLIVCCGRGKDLSVAVSYSLIKVQMEYLTISFRSPFEKPTKFKWTVMILVRKGKYLRAMHRIASERHPPGTNSWPMQRIDANCVWWRRCRDRCDVAPHWHDLAKWSSNRGRLSGIHRNANTRSEWVRVGLVQMWSK